MVVVVVVVDCVGLGVDVVVVAVVVVGCVSLGVVLMGGLWW